MYKVKQEQSLSSSIIIKFYILHCTSMVGARVPWPKDLPVLSNWYSSHIPHKLGFTVSLKPLSAALNRKTSRQASRTISSSRVWVVWFIILKYPYDFTSEFFQAVFRFRGSLIFPQTIPRTPPDPHWPLWHFADPKEASRTQCGSPDPRLTITVLDIGYVQWYYYGTKVHVQCNFVQWDCSLTPVLYGIRYCRSQEDTQIRPWLTIAKFISETPEYWRQKDVFLWGLQTG